MTAPDEPLGLPCARCACDVTRHREPERGELGYPCGDCDCAMFIGRVGQHDGRPKGDLPVTVSLVEESRDPGHTRVKVRVGRGRHSRALSGVLTLRSDEWDELVAAAADPLAFRDRVEITVGDVIAEDP